MEGGGRPVFVNFQNLPSFIALGWGERAPSIFFFKKLKKGFFTIPFDRPFLIRFVFSTDDLCLPRWDAVKKKGGLKGPQTPYGHRRKTLVLHGGVFLTMEKKKQGCSSNFLGDTVRFTGGVLFLEGPQ